MQYEEFVGKVNDRVGTTTSEKASENTQYAIQATLVTLGEHLTGSEAQALAARLPPELEAQLASGNYAETAKGFSAEEFHRRVAEREDASGPGNDSEQTRATAQATAEAVLAVLEEAGGGGFGESPQSPRQPPQQAAPVPNA